jgi:hypothetical protein
VRITFHLEDCSSSLHQWIDSSQYNLFERLSNIVIAVTSTSGRVPEWKYVVLLLGLPNAISTRLLIIHLYHTPTSYFNTNLRRTEGNAEFHHTTPSFAEMKESLLIPED